MKRYQAIMNINTPNEHRLTFNSISHTEAMASLDQNGDWILYEVINNKGKWVATNTSSKHSLANKLNTIFGAF